MSKPGSFKPALLFQNQAINHFESRIQQQKTLLQTIRAALPDTLSNRVQHAIVNGNKLVIYCDSAAWAAQLRFYEKALLANILPVSKNTDTLLQIKLVIETVGPSQTRHEETAHIPAPDKLEAIRSYCLAVPENELTAALLKLTETLERIRTKGVA
jgi:hypothetical protein